MGNLLGAPVTDKHTETGSTADGVQFGVSSMQGWRVHMEDAHIAETRIYASEIVEEEKRKGSGDQKTGGSSNDNSKEDATSAAAVEKRIKIDLPGHSLFAVFDGHGGTFAAMYSGSNMCRVLSRQPKFVKYAKWSTQERPEKEKSLKTEADRAQYLMSGLELLESALTDAFVDIDKEIALALKGQKVADADQPYHDEEQATGEKQAVAAEKDTAAVDNGPSENQPMPDAESGDDAMDILQSSAGSASQSPEEEKSDSGTTACVVFLTPDWIICANAGDSRSVISRLGNRAVPLSYDHKPDDEEEERRIRNAGGYVAGGRVEGDLAVSRGLGDFRFKKIDVVMAAPYPNLDNVSNNPAKDASQLQYGQEAVNVMTPGDQKVSPIPDIIVQNRNAAADEFVIIACDGIWDVQSNHEAVQMTAELFKEGESNLGLLAEEVRIL